MNSLKLASSTDMKYDENSKGSLESFPDDILIDIFNRLQVECVLQCRRVCKRWKNLTSTSHFNELQSKMAKPSFLVQNWRRPRKSYLVSNDEETETGKLMVMPIYNYFTHLIDEPEIIDFHLISSCHGLILCRAINGNDCVICNPVTREKITLPTSEKLVYPRGFFFHPLTMEHRVLYSYRENGLFGYKIFSLETNSWRDLPYSSCINPSPLNATIVNESLYWLTQKGRGGKLADLVLMFDVNSEVFDTISPPVTEKFKNVKLLEAEGELYFCCLQRQSSKAMITIWILAASAKTHWVEMYKIHHELPFVDSRSSSIITIYNNKLLLQCLDDGLLAYDLQRGTIKYVESKGERQVYFSMRDVHKLVSFKKSLVSPKHSLQVLKEK